MFGCLQEENRLEDTFRYQPGPPSGPRGAIMTAVLKPKYVKVAHAEAALKAYVSVPLSNDFQVKLALNSLCPGFGLSYTDPHKQARQNSISDPEGSEIRCYNT